MLFGWEVFRYRKKIASDGDHRSVCNTAILPHGQTIFTDERRDCVSIYGSPSRHIEVFVCSETVEVRLAVWARESTTSILLEKLRIGDAEVRTKERCVLFRWKEREFSVDFYRRAEAAAFVERLSDGLDAKARFIEQIRRMCGPLGESEKADVDGLDDLVSKLSMPRD